MKYTMYFQFVITCYILTYMKRGLCNSLVIISRLKTNIKHMHTTSTHSSTCSSALSDYNLFVIRYIDANPQRCLVLTVCCFSPRYINLACRHLSFTVVAFHYNNALALCRRCSGAQV